MATDTTNIQNTVAHESDVDRVVLTQGATQVQVPQGENVVRVQVTPGEAIQLPFAQTGMIARLDDGNGNLAIKVGDITVILQGYVAAAGEAEVTLLDSDGQQVDVAAVVAATDPNLDIQTAAGPGAGDQGTGADNNGGVFSPFDPRAGIGGLNAIGGLQATALQYNLIEREAIVYEVEEEDADTVPTVVNITQAPPVNEDDLKDGPNWDEVLCRLNPKEDGGEGNDGQESAAVLQEGEGHAPKWVLAHEYDDGNDPFDGDDHEEGSQTDFDGDGKSEFEPIISDNGFGGVDRDREPTSVTAIVEADFFGDLPGKLVLDKNGNGINDGGDDVPLITVLEGMGLTSHGHALTYKLLPEVPESAPGANDGQGQMVVAYYTVIKYGCPVNVVVFTIGVDDDVVRAGETNTDGNAEFGLSYTIYGVLDHPEKGGGTGEGNGVEDILKIEVPFFLKDSDSAPVPSDFPQPLEFQNIDDIPFLGEVCYISVCGFDVPLAIVKADLTIGHDETPGQQDTNYDTNGDAKGGWNETDDVGGGLANYLINKADDLLDGIANGHASGEGVDINYQQDILSQLSPEFLQNGNFCADTLGVAKTYLTVSFGADGKAKGNDQAGDTLFQHDDDKGTDGSTHNYNSDGTKSGDASGVDKRAFELFMKDTSSDGTNPVLSQSATNWTISYVDGSGVVHTLVVQAFQLDANTIIGMAFKPEGQGGGGNDALSLLSEGEGSGTHCLSGEGTGIPVFMLRLDPDSGQLVFVQYHQVNNPLGGNADHPDYNNSANDPSHLTDAEGNPLVFFQATDFDGDTVTASLQVSVIDDAPKAKDDYADVDEGCDTVCGNLITGISYDGNNGNNVGKDKLSVDEGHKISALKHDGVTYKLVLDAAGNPTGEVEIEGGPLDGTTTNLTPDGKLVIDTELGGKLTVQMTETGSEDLGWYEYKSPESVEHGDPVFAGFTPKADGSNDSESKWANAFKNYNIEKAGSAGDGFNTGDVEIKTVTVPAGNGNEAITYRGIGLTGGIDGAETDKNDGAMRIGFPGAADQWSATVTVGALFADNPNFDGGRTEQLTWKIYDNGVLVGQGVVEGDYDGIVQFHIAEGIKFDRIELSALDNGAGNNGNNSDFLLLNVTTTKCDDDKTEKFEYTLQDADGDTSKATLNIDVEDLGPDAGCGVKQGSQTVVKEAAINDGQDPGQDGGSNPGSPSEVATGQIQGFDLGPDSQGAAINIQLIDANDSDSNSNNGTVINDVGDLRSKGQPLTLVSDGGIPATITAYRQGDNVKVFELQIDGQGNYQFKLFDQLDHPDQGENGEETGHNDVINLKFEYTIVDGDACAPGQRDSQNDVAKGTITIAVQDDGPTICGVEYNYGDKNGIVDEDHLTKGIDGGPGDIGSYDNKATGQVIVDKGADQPVTFTFNETDGNTVYVKDQHGNTLPLTDLAGNPVKMDVENNFSSTTAKLYGKANGETLFIITLNKSTGEFELELLKPVKHPFQDDGNGKNGIEFSWEDDLALFNVDIKVTDFDGDFDTTKIEFLIDDDSPKIHDNHVSVTLDEDVIPGANGNHPGGPGDTSPSYYTRSGSLGIGFGADGKGSLTIALDDPSPKLSATGQTLSWTQIGDTLIGHTGNTNDPAMTIKVEDDGDFTVTILKPLKHSDGNGENDLDIDFKVTATDKDGDKVTGKISVEIDDDSPELSVKDYVDQNTGKGQGSAHHGSGWGYVDEDYLTKGNKDQGQSQNDAIGGTKSVALLNVAAGADGKKSLTIVDIDVHGDDGNGLRRSSDGAKVILVSDDGGITWVGYADTSGNGSLSAGEKVEANKVLTIKVVGDTVEFELFQPLQHDSTDSNYNSGDNNVEGDIKFDVKVRLTDNDNDSVEAEVNFLVDDDQPYLTGVVINGTVEEEALKQGNQELGDAEPDTNVASGSLGTLVGLGADQPGNWSIIAGNLNQLPTNLKSGGLTVTFSMEGGDIVGKAGGQEVMRLDVNSDGTYTFTLSKQLDHPAGNGENSIAIDFGKVIKVTDNDNDSVNIGSGKFIINVVDDKPEVGQTLQWTVDEDGKWLAGGGSAPLAGGIPGGPGDTGDDWISFSGNLGVSFGQDGPAANPYTMSTTVSAFAPNGSPMALTSGGVPVTYSWAGNVLTASAGPDVVFTATVDQATGNVTIQLKGPLDHPNTSADENAGQVPNSEFEDTIRIELGFEAKDFDGDVVTGKVNMFVNDDTPDACCMETPVVVEQDGGVIDIADVTVNPSNYLNQDVAALVTITVSSPNGGAVLNTNNNTADKGFGVTSNGGNGEARYNEINYLGDGSQAQQGEGYSEVMTFKLAEGKFASSAVVDFNVFFGSEGAVGNEVGQYMLYKDGNPVSGWISFTANSGSGDLNGVVINGPAGGFDEIRFIAAPGTTDGDGNSKGDSSDYNIEQIKFDLFEGEPTSACGYVCGDNGIQYGADGPGSAVLIANPDNNAQVNGQKVVESVSQDGHTLQGKVGDTVVYTVTLDPVTGKYHFNLIGELDSDETNLEFKFKVTDADGDSDAGCIKITVEGKDDVPTLDVTYPEPLGTAGYGLVDEDHLTENGNTGNQDLPDASPGDDFGSTDNVTTGGYNADFKGDTPGTVGFNTADETDTGIDTLDGTNILWNRVSDTEMVGYKQGTDASNPANQYFKMTLTNADMNGDGNWTFELLKPVKHGLPGTEDNLALQVEIIAKDADQDPVTAKINVQIDDDLQNAQGKEIAVNEKGVSGKANVMFILDVSTSMLEASGVAGKNRLQVAKEAILATAQKYFDGAGDPNVRFQLVTFNNNANVPSATWMTFAEFQAELAAVGTGSWTNYDAALIDAEVAFNGSGKIDGAANVSYFLSDGEPNQGASGDGYNNDSGPGSGTSGDDGIGSNEEAGWTDFLKDNDIVSHAIGIGPGATSADGIAELNPIAYDGRGAGTNTGAISVANMADLEAILGDIAAVPAEGNLLSQPGADGWAQQAISQIWIDGQGGVVNPDANGVMVLDTSAGTLTVYGKAYNGHAAGDYVFVPKNVDSNTPIVFKYKTVDGDGDTRDGTFHVTVNNVNKAPEITSPASVNFEENGVGVAYDINAKDGDGDSITYSISGADAGLFNVDANSGAVTFKNAPNFESPVDAGGNNVYDIVVHANDGTTTTDKNVAITVTNKNETPFNLVDTDGAAGGSVAENAANGTQVGIDVQASDPDNGGAFGTLTYSLSNNAGGRFQINANTGVVTVANGALLDYESNTSHQITVVATDGGGLSTSQNFTINIGNVAENQAPQGVANNIYSNSFENQTIQKAWLLRNDSDPDGNPLTVSAITESDGDFSFDNIQTNSFELNIDGQDMENGESGDYSYTLTDGTTPVSVTGGKVHYDTDGALDGGSGDDIVIGNGTLNGNNGNDVVVGGSGGDTLNGGAGNDWLLGQGGDDTLVFDANDQTVDGGSGFDRIQTTEASFAFDNNPTGGAKFAGVEMIDLGDSNHNGNRTVTINAADVLDQNAETVDVDQNGSGTNNVQIDLFIIGDHNSGTTDNVNLTGFTKIADLDNQMGNQDSFTFNDGTFGSHTFNLYSNGAGKVIAVEVGLDVITN